MAQAEGPAQGREQYATGPPLGGRNRHAANLTDLVKPAKGPQKQHNVKITAQNNDPDSFESEEEMEYDAWKAEKILIEPIQAVQLNVNRSLDGMPIMQQEYIRNTDILLYQEPAFSRSTLPHHLFLTPKILHNDTPYTDRSTTGATSEPSPQSDGLCPRAERRDRCTEIRHMP